MVRSSLLKGVETAQIDLSYAPNKYDNSKLLRENPKAKQYENDISALDDLIGSFNQISTKFEIEE